MFIVYGKEDCSFCDKAKALLNEKNIPFTYIDVGMEGNEKELTYVRSRLVARSVPQIVHKTPEGEFHVGGYDELVRYTHLV